MSGCVESTNRGSLSAIFPFQSELFLSVIRGGPIVLVKNRLFRMPSTAMFELMAVVWEENILFLVFTVPEVERMPSLF